MEKSRDSSVWRNLAVAFGDGLAFGVGMKLTQNAPEKNAPPSQAELAGRLARLEQKFSHIERAPMGATGGGSLDPEVLEALTHALEARLQENAAQMERRLSEQEVKIAVELKALRQQDHVVASNTEARLEELRKGFDDQVLGLLKKVNEDRNAVTNQVIALHREFASAVADIVEEQVAAQVEARVSTLAEQRLADLLQQQLAPIEEQFRNEVAAKNREIAELRRRAITSDQNVLELMLATGEWFRQAADRLSGQAAMTPVAEPAPVEPAALAAVTPVEPAPPPAVTESASPDDSAQPAGAPMLFRDSDLPSFAQPRRAAAAAGWSIPLVTSFVVTAGCVALLQYL